MSCLLQALDCPSFLFAHLIFLLPEILSSYSFSWHWYRLWLLVSGCLGACDEKLYHLSGFCRQEVKLQEKGLVSAVPSAVSGLTLLHALLLITFKMLHCTVFSLVSRREDKKLSRYGGHKIESDTDVMHFTINARKIMLDCTRKIHPPFTKK